MLIVHHDTQHNDIQYNDTQHKGFMCGIQHKKHPARMILSITMGCQYAECHYAECHVSFIIMLNIITLCLYSECHSAKCRYDKCHGATYKTAYLTFAVLYSSFQTKSYLGSVKANGTEHEGFYGQVFNFKLGCFVTVRILMGYTRMYTSKVKNLAVSINEIVPKT